MPPLLRHEPPDSIRAKTFDIIFGHDKGWGRQFDAFLMVLILGSVAVVMLDSVAGIRTRHGHLLRIFEWTFTALFTLEYAIRIWCVRNPRRYALSFFGIIDVLSVLPTYLSLFLPGGQFLAVIRILRVVRVFRVFKLVRFIGEASLLATAFRNARYKISVFLVTVVCSVFVIGSLMYVIEGPVGGFTSIPRGVYWAIVTLTTVGFGDIAPVTTMGQILASFVMILGYGVIAVPTGIMTAELAQLPGGKAQGAHGYVFRECPRCEAIDRDADARFCRFCAEALSEVRAAEPTEPPR